MIAPFRIMIVEDSITQAMKLQATLEQQGWLVVCERHAEDAMTDIQRHPPDLIIVDFVLPGMRGDELCRQVRMNIGTRHIPLIMLTADDDEGMEVRGLDSGADDFMVKSQNQEYLVLRVRSLLEKSRKLSSVVRPANTHFKRAS